jgi:hypothetical protein
MASRDAADLPAIRIPLWSRTIRLGRLLSVITAAALTLGAAQASASIAVAHAASCPSVQLIGVRGSGEHSGLGHTVGAVVSSIYQIGIPGAHADTIEYPAIDVPLDPLTRSYRNNYVESVVKGVKALHNFVASFEQRCGSTPLLLAGYSQGAEVIDDWLLGALSNGQRVNIAGVALFGDPRFNPAQVLPVDVGTFNHRFAGIGIYQFQPAIGTFGTLVNYPISDAGLVRSYCANHDPICNLSSPALAASCVLSSCAHYHYADLTFGKPATTYTHAAATFLISRWRAVSATPGPTNPGGSGPPSGETSGPSGSEGPGPTPSPTYSETTGGVVHTWTNYTNAGGTEGPSIPSNDTIEIACRLPGFAVADGNTWWYRIASSPWNGAYYASADAFYNNGQASGSLIGTPFVDPAVASC